MEGSYDVVIIGGGISGLYSAWRLGKETNLKILLLESTDRYGGRFHTVTMPGGYKADLGAMRISPSIHKIENYLVEEFNIESKEMMAKDEPSNTLPEIYWRGKRAAHGSELFDIMGICGEDKNTLLHLFSNFDPTHSCEEDIDIPDNRNFAEATIKKTGQKTNELTVKEYLQLTGNPIVTKLGDLLITTDEFPLTGYLALETIFKEFYKPGAMHNVVGGFESVTSAIVDAINRLRNVDIKLLHDVISVEERDQNQFVVYVRHNEALIKFEAEKIIFACASNGMKKINLISAKQRQEVIQDLVSQTYQLPAVKVFMTYPSAWWEEYGLHNGAIHSNMLIHQTVAFGNAGVTGGYATILVTYTHRDIDLFQDLDRPHHARYQNEGGENIPEDLVPSEALVEHCEQQLYQVLGCDKPHDPPVCVVRKYWGVEGSQGFGQFPKLGIDSNKLHWESLKPFSDAEVYIASDCFPPSDRSMLYMGFAEGSLLTSERILVNHFGLNPVKRDLCLENPWPLTS